MKKVLEYVAIFFTVAFIFFIIAMVIQIMGKDTENEATIIAGALGLCGGLLGMMGVMYTTNILVKAQQYITLEQVEMADFRERERSLLSYYLSEYDRIIKYIWEIDSSLTSFQNSIKSVVQLKKMTSTTIPPTNPMYIDLIKWEYDVINQITVEIGTVQNKLLNLICSSPTEKIGDLKLNELNDEIKNHLEELRILSEHKNVTPEQIRKKIDDDLTEIKKKYVEIIQLAIDLKYEIIAKFQEQNIQKKSHI